jgi:WD40 repeat protein
VRLFEGHVNRTHPIGICFSPCFRFIACGSEDKACYIYDVLSGSQVSRLSGSTDVVSDVSYSPVHPQLVRAFYTLFHSQTSFDEHFHLIYYSLQ